MADVFISYSRRDSVFARRLAQALADTGRESWVDWSSIPYSEDWWREICLGIDGADNFLFIISPDSLMSMVCNKEIAYAREHNKRIIPLLHREVLKDGKPLAEITTAWYEEDWEPSARENLIELERLNWLFFREQDDFSEWFGKLITTTEQDPEHVKTHTRLLLWAREWERQGRNPSSLLKGDDLRAAESWLAGSGEKEPSPLELHQLYVTTSRHVEDELAAETARRERLIRRFRWAAGGLLAIGILAVIAAAGAFASSQQAQASANIAATQAADAEQREANAITAVAIANATLTPIPPTLTQAAILREDALIEQEIVSEFADVLLQSDNASDSLSRINSLVALYPDRASAYLVRGIVYFEQGQYETALADYSRAIELDPRYALAYNNRGNAYFEQGQYETALADYDQAIELDPQDAQAHNSRGNVYYKQGQFEAALADYSQAIERDAQYADAYSNRGLAYHELGQLEAALADYNKTIELDPQHAEAFNNRGIVYREQGQYEAALADYSRAIELDPQYARAYYNRGNAYYEQGQYEAALADYSEAIELDPQSVQVHVNRGIAYLEQGQYEAAVADFTQAIELDPQLALAYSNRGTTHAIQGDYEAALADFNRVIELEPEDTQAYLSRAFAYAMMDQIENAEQDLEVFAGLGGSIPDTFRSLFELAGVSIPGE